jgi:hypothetical protein
MILYGPTLEKEPLKFARNSAERRILGARMTVLSEKFLRFFGRVTHCVALSMLLASCGIKSEISVTTVGAGLEGVTVSKIRPIEAKPSDLLTIEGSNFSASKDLRARVSLEDGSTKDVPLKVIDRTKGTFVMPEGAGLGLKSVSIFQGGSTQVYWQHRNSDNSCCRQCAIDGTSLW